MRDTRRAECPHCQGVPPSSDGKTECGWCTPDHVPSVVPDRSWVHEDFDERESVLLSKKSMSETANPNSLCWDDPDPGGERDYSMAFGYLGDGRERMAAIQWGFTNAEAGLVMVPFDVLLSAVTQGWEEDDGTE